MWSDLLRYPFCMRILVNEYIQKRPEYVILSLSVYIFHNCRTISMRNIAFLITKVLVFTKFNYIQMKHNYTKKWFVDCYPVAVGVTN